MPGYKLGKLPARQDAIKLKFADFFDATKLPKPPGVFGHQWKVREWDMLGNDRYGNCVWAGAAHETMVLTATGRAGVPAPFNDKAVLSDYSAVTGFDPRDPNSDQGTDMQKAAAYRQKVGVIDSRGSRHKIVAYVELKAGNLQQLALATWMFGCSGIGLELPSTAEDQFDKKQPWHIDPNSRIDGGHYVSGLGRNAAGNFLVATWGALQEMTPSFYSRYCDEACGYLSSEFLLKNDLSPEGFDLASLQQHLAKLT